MSGPTFYSLNCISHSCNDAGDYNDDYDDGWKYDCDDDCNDDDDDDDGCGMLPQYLLIWIWVTMICVTYLLVCTTLVVINNIMNFTDNYKSPMLLDETLTVSN